MAWDATTKDYTAKPGETNVVFAFGVTNVSASEVSITGVTTSCGCAKASLPSVPWRLAPGANGQLKVDVNFTGKSGLLTKAVVVDTSHGPKALLFRVQIPDDAESRRLRNQQLAQMDRQAVFKGDCAKCHAEPARGKIGKELYQAACGNCHDSEHRATMVPDLKNLQQPTNRAYWRQWVSHGKAATLMPAFAQKEGGPLTAAQVDSLVDFLSQSK